MARPFKVGDSTIYRPLVVFAQTILKKEMLVRGKTKFEKCNVEGGREEANGPVPQFYFMQNTLFFYFISDVFTN